MGFWRAVILSRLGINHTACCQDILTSLGSGIDTNTAPKQCWNTLHVGLLGWTQLKPAYVGNSPGSPSTAHNCIEEKGSWRG
jgi:hypothetical protein